MKNIHPLVELAKSAVENYIKNGQIISPPPDLPEEYLKNKAGVFITIKTIGDYLRGCIGTYLPTQENIAKEVIENAVTAATRDYRFGPVKEEEFDSLSYTVYLLGEPELVEDKKDLDPGKYGVLVRTSPLPSSDHLDVSFNGRSPFKSGLLLPDLEGINTPEEQIAIACQKGGIDHQKEKIMIYRFSVIKYGQ